MIAILARAQNLVPNPGFEEYTECPSIYGELFKTNDWFAAFVSPEYYNSCDTSDIVGVPNNMFGFQQPATGAAYTGIWSYSNGDPGFGLHEVMGVHLPQPLVVGQTYWASFKASWTSGYPFLDAMVKYASNNLGILLSMDSLSGEGDWLPWPNRAHIHTEQIITDSIEWTTIAGQFVADSAYRYLYVGNFFGDDQTEAIIMQPDADEVGYYYIDDVCLSATPTFCPVATSVGESAQGSSFCAHWDVPAHALLVSGLPAGNYRSTLFDAAGRVTAEALLNSNGQREEVAIDIDPKGMGMFILRIQGGGHAWHYKLVPLVR
ncbi:MAG: hypothetical protein JST66_03195 [Bacteroidetes bacterium]|nr:hypothetical protein [Bacteroidota bacterium]